MLSVVMVCEMSIRRQTCNAPISTRGSLYSSAIEPKPGVVLFSRIPTFPLGAPAASALNPTGSDPDSFEIEFDIGEVGMMMARPRDIYKTENYMSDTVAAQTGLPTQRYFRMVVSNVSKRKPLIDFVTSSSTLFTAAYTFYGPVRYLDGHSCYEQSMSRYGFYALTNPGYDIFDSTSPKEPEFKDVINMVFNAPVNTAFNYLGVNYDGYTIASGTASRVVYSVTKS